MSTLCSILICTKGRQQHLEQTLSRISELQIPRQYDLEVVLVDNGPDESTRAVVERANEAVKFPIHYLAAGGHGVSYGRNQGLRKAQGEIILITDDDVRVPTNWIEAMVGPIASDEADVVSGLLILPDSHQRTWLEPVHLEMLSISPAHLSDTNDCQTLITGNCAFHRRVLEKITGFNEQIGPGQYYGGGEDELFAWQARDAGYRIVLRTAGAVEHHFDESRFERDSLIRTAINRGRGNAWLMVHYFGRRVSLPWLRYWYQRAKLLLHQIRVLRTGVTRNPPSARELHLRKLIAMYEALASGIETKLTA